MAEKNQILSKLLISYKLFSKYLTYFFFSMGCIFLVMYLIATVHDFYVTNNGFSCAKSEIDKTPFNWDDYPDVDSDNGSVGNLSKEESLELKVLLDREWEDLVLEKCKVKISKGVSIETSSSTQTWGAGSYLRSWYERNEGIGIFAFLCFLFAFGIYYFNKWLYWLFT